ncbi:MAG TPA: long-chain fatty acid--CoA ligase [Bacteroidia bacterium]|nr:long-chain fatty acid--CoA ligase [Bacteroidia bacterium]
MCQRTFDIVLRAEKNYPDLIAFAHKKEGQWRYVSYREYAKLSKKLAKALIANDVVKGDHIATLTNNRPEWNVLDAGINMAGAVHVPVSPFYSEDDLHYIIEHTDISLIFVFNKILYQVIRRICSNIPLVRKIILIEDAEDIPSLNHFLEEGNDVPDEVLERRISETGEEDIQSIYFTSGTGGRPKGAMVRHRNILRMMKSMSEIYFLKKGEKALSYLPLSHSYESAHNYMYQHAGMIVYYAESMNTVVGNLQEVKPVIFLSVPLLLDKIAAEIQSMTEKQTGSKKRIWQNAWNFAINYNPENRSLIYRLKHNYYRKKVFPFWKEVLGEKVTRISAGGASLPEHLARLFFAMDIMVLEVYGMTETYAISVNSFQYGIKIGTVGVPEKNVEVRLDEEGEILCRSPYIIKGYYKNPELTAEIIDPDGWFHTGDLGEWVDGKYLKITGRKKHVFKTASGNFISPENIEKQLVKSRFISHALVVGKDKNYLSAILVPDFNELKNYCQERKYETTNWKIVLNDLEIRSLFQKVIDEYNRNAWETEQIKKFSILDHPWSVQTGELTPTMKLKRNNLLERYDGMVKQFYE